MDISYKDWINNELCLLVASQPRDTILDVFVDWHLLQLKELQEKIKVLEEKVK